MQYTIQNTDELLAIARDVINTFPDIRVILLEGDLGSGKTTFTKAFCKELGITEVVSSPTFSIVQEYQGPIPVYHFDLYRIKNEDELFQIGFEEYFRNDGYKLIEWPQIAMPLIDEGYIAIRFNLQENGSRIISIVE